MEIPEILHELEENRGYFPLAAVAAAIARRDEMIPHLLRILEETVSHPEKVLENDANMAHLYSFYLLAQFRVTAAYPLAIRFARLPGDMPYELTGDFITEDLSRVLASVCGGDLDPLKRLVEDSAVDEFLRIAGVEAFKCLFVVGQLPRADLVAYYGYLLREGLADGAEEVCAAVVGCATDIHPGELLEDIRQAYAAGRVDSSFVGLREVEAAAAKGPAAVLAKLRRQDDGLIDDTVDCMEWWHCFHETDGVEGPTDHEDDGDDEEEDYDDAEDEEIYVDDASPVVDERNPDEWGAPDDLPPGETHVREKPKVGRNEPCPCGSGRKYKKCCGA